VLLGLALAATLPVGEAAAQKKDKKKVDIYRQTDLDFYRAAQNQGVVYKPITEPMVAKFLVEVRLKKNKTTTLQVDVTPPPQGLTNGNGDAVTYSDVDVAYRLRQDDPNTATEESTSFSVDLPMEEGTIDVYLYVYGSATVGNQPTGTYQGPVTVEVTRYKN
jgi:hypothetical protein